MLHRVVDHLFVDAVVFVSKTIAQSHKLGVSCGRIVVEDFEIHELSKRTVVVCRSGKCLLSDNMKIDIDNSTDDSFQISFRKDFVSKIRQVL